VRTRAINETGAVAGEETLAADLVVDASGRASQAQRWLEELGYPAPRETVIASHLGYASRYYAPPPGFQARWRGLYLQYAPPTALRAGTLVPVEGDRWLVGLFGLSRDYPPTDEAGFLEFARSLRSPLLYEAIRDARPLAPIVGYRATENRLRHYDLLPRRPEGLLVLGDAACTFNPVYGQGMTVAAAGALALAGCLRAQGQRGDLRGLAARFQRRLARQLAPVWTLATNGDLRAPGTEGGRVARTRRIPGWTMCRPRPPTPSRWFHRQHAEGRGYPGTYTR
jgi:flavin-dependent dehydrogenase